MMEDIENIVGRTFGKLLVLKEDHVNYFGSTIFKCRCKCENKTIVFASGKDLLNSRARSCGCLYVNNDVVKNIYDLSGEFGICYAKDGKEFIFDLEDYDKIKKYRWSITKKGYVISSISSTAKNIFIHRLIMDCEKDMFVDHKNFIKTDNRKENLRIVNSSQNNINKKIRKDNSTGIIGVVFTKSKKWRAQIRSNNKTMNLGTFEEFRDAVFARLCAEKKYFGEFAPQQNLFDEFGVI